MAPLSHYSQTKTASKTPTGGVAHSAWGQECWQLISQWVWNLRLELGHQLEPTPLRTTEFAPALPRAEFTVPHVRPHPLLFLDTAHPPRLPAWKTGRFTGPDFPLQPDGTLRCPQAARSRSMERRQEADGSLRVVCRQHSQCRPCELREQCQWNGSTTKKPRQESRLLHPLAVGPAPLRLREIGAAENIGVPVSNSCGTNASK